MAPPRAYPEKRQNTFNPDHVDALLARIRETRADTCRLYPTITEAYSLSLDYSVAPLAFGAERSAMPDRKSCEIAQFSQGQPGIEADAHHRPAPI